MVFMPRGPLEVGRRFSCRVDRSAAGLELNRGRFGAGFRQPGVEQVDGRGQAEHRLLEVLGPGQRRQVAIQGVFQAG